MKRALQQSSRTLLSSHPAPSTFLPRLTHLNSKASTSISKCSSPKCRAFTSSSRNFAKEESNSHVQAGKSPWATFKETLRSELEKNREFRENVKTLGGEVGKVQDSAVMRKAKEMYEKTQLIAAIKNNPRLQQEAARLKKMGVNVGSVVDSTVKEWQESEANRALKRAYNAVGSAISTASEPLRNTETYKTVAASINEALDDVESNMRYGGFIEKEARRRRHEVRLKKLGKGGLAGQGMVRIEANPEAGEAITLHASANVPDSSIRARLASVTPQPVLNLLTSASTSYQNSENPFISTLRSVTSTIGSVFEENEQAKVIGAFKILDPTFQQETFLRDVREYIIPELVDAFVSGDLPTLRQWMDEGPFNVLTAGLTPMLEQGLVSDGQVLDIRSCDLVSAKMLEELNLPVFIIAARTQETLVYRHPFTEEVIKGKENSIEQVGYVVVLTRRMEDITDEITGGWRVVDIARRSDRATV